MTGRGDLETARAAFDRGEWSTARTRYLATKRSGALPSPDAARLGEACWWMGMIEDALRVYEGLHREWMSVGADTDAAMAAIFLGMHEALRGRAAVASGWLARARRLLADDPTAREHGFLLYLETDGALDAGDLTGAADLAARIVDIAEVHADPTLRAMARCVEGTVALRRGEAKAGLAILDEAMLPVVAGEVERGWGGNLYCHMMSTCHDIGDLRRARQWTDTTERWCAGFDEAVTFVGICRMHRIDLLLADGQWDRALEQARVACDELAGIEVGAVGEAHYQLAELYRLRDDLRAASAAYDRAHQLGRNPQPGLTLLHLRRGRIDQAAASIDVALAGSPDLLRRAPLLAVAAEVAIARGDASAAIHFAGELRDIADGFASPGWMAAARQWEGAALLSQHRPSDALPSLRDALERWRAVEVPYEEARVRVELARADEALGDHDGARRELDLAAGEFTSLGAAHDLRGVASLRHGGVEGLTPREMEVVAAIAPGRSNHEAALHLHISERTVARHLANVYTKTGLTNRTAVVTWSREHGLL